MRMSWLNVAFKQDVALSFTLLRYINSVGFGFSPQVRSIRHALTMLGYRQLHRWLTLLLVTAGEGRVPAVLVKTAIIRGRLSEPLGENHLRGHERDNLFIVGIFSVLDAILEMAMERVVETLGLPELIGDALLHRRGIYGSFPELAEACEGSDFERIEQFGQPAPERRQGESIPSGSRGLGRGTYALTHRVVRWSSRTIASLGESSAVMA